MENKDAVAKALGKVSSGLYVVTSKNGETYTGFTASFLVQVSFEPALIAVSMKKGRNSYDAIMESKGFVVNVMGKDNMKLVGTFAKPRPDGDSPFEGVSYEVREFGFPILTDSIAYINCKVHSTTEAGDHIVVFGEVVGGELLKEGTEVATHIRKNGFSY